MLVALGAKQFRTVRGPLLILAALLLWAAWNFSLLPGRILALASVDEFQRGVLIKAPNGGQYHPRLGLNRDITGTAYFLSKAQASLAGEL